MVMFIYSFGYVTIKGIRYTINETLYITLPSKWQLFLDECLTWTELITVISNKIAGSIKKNSISCSRFVNKSEGLAQGPYMVARAGFEPTTLRSIAINSTYTPLRPTSN